MILIYRDKNDNVYVKTGRKSGFMTRISDGTRHDGTTVGEFRMVRAVEVDEYDCDTCRHFNCAKDGSKIKIHHCGDYDRRKK